MGVIGLGEAEDLRLGQRLAEHAAQIAEHHLRGDRAEMVEQFAEPGHFDVPGSAQVMAEALVSVWVSETRMRGDAMAIEHGLGVRAGDRPGRAVGVALDGEIGRINEDPERSRAGKVCSRLPWRRNARPGSQRGRSGTGILNFSGREKAGEFIGGLLRSNLSIAGDFNRSMPHRAD